MSQDFYLTACNGYFLPATRNNVHEALIGLLHGEDLFPRATLERLRRTDPSAVHTRTNTHSKATCSQCTFGTQFSSISTTGSLVLNVNQCGVFTIAAGHFQERLLKQVMSLKFHFK